MLAAERSSRAPARLLHGRLAEKGWGACGGESTVSMSVM